MVVINTVDYHRQGYRQLSFYQHLDEDPTIEVNTKIYKVINKILMKYLISPKVAQE